MSDQQEPAIEAGMNPDAAIAAMMRQCELRWAAQCNPKSPIDWLMAQSDVPNIASFDEETRTEPLAHLRKYLSTPITQHEAAMLCRIGFGGYSVESAARSIRHPDGPPEDDCGAVADDSLPPISGRPDQGYWLDFDASGDFEHWFGGECPIPADVCINCEKPLLHFLSLDTRDPRVDLTDCLHRHLPLLFCWTCEPTSEFLYRVEPSGVRIVEAPLGGRLDDFPYPNYPESFPRRRVGLQAVPSKEQGLIRQIIYADIDLPREYDHLHNAKHQIGGEAFLWQPLQDDFECPVCTSAMPFLATICDNAEGPDVEGEYKRSFTDNLGVQVVYHLCRRCWIVGAYQICD